MSFAHLPVMAAEALNMLAPRSGGIYLDGTVGGGGHASLILDASSPDGVLIGFDRDPAAIAAASRRLAPFAGRVRLVQRNFADLAAVLGELAVGMIDGLLLDLGVSSPQLDGEGRGFSFQRDEPLDMRMDPTVGETAADLVNALPEKDLALLIAERGEERWARRIAAAIVKARQQSPIVTTGRLAEIIQGAIPRRFQEERLHPATRTFQALRITVNDELESLRRGLADGLDRLRSGGRAVVISFHSLEDRIVKELFRDLATGCRCPRGLPVCSCGAVPLLRVLTARPVRPGPEELSRNPRARSARLRAAEKL